MALLRACNIPCRVHGFTIDKRLQKGAMTGFVYCNAPKSIFHSWVEINFENQWYELEAFILDKTYIKKLQEQNSECTGAFCGYGVAVKDFRNLIIEFDRNNTYIQSEGINQDFGVYDCPDELLKDCLLYTSRKALPEQSRNMHWRCVMQFWMYGNQHRIRRQSLTCR